MIIGLDFYKTISAYPKQFKALVSSLTSEGHEILVISALGKNSNVENYKRHVTDFLKLHNISYKELHIVVFEKDDKIPQLKLESCQKLGVEIYFDDREDVCKLLNENKILAMRVGAGKNRKDKRFFK